MGSWMRRQIRRDREPPVAQGGSAILLDSATRMFGLTPALVRVSLRVERGEVLLIRGHNGAGKSTLLRVIATALAPTYGGGTVLGFDLSTGREDIRRRTELVGHRTRLYEDLSAEENLRFTCTLHGLDPSGVPDALDRVGLGPVRADRVRGFSAGMRQRVSLARGLLRDPELLLLDDPYAGLDAEARKMVDGAISDGRDRGQTVVVATHDPEAARLATRTALMDGGRLVAEPAEVAAR
jgi:ABC-type multidrug transport system ATPase subunit